MQLEVQIGLGIVLASVIAFTALRLRALTVGGAVAATAVGAIVFGLGGWPFACPLLTFFITSTLLSRWRKRIKDDVVTSKGTQRDAGQVLANGGVAAAIALCHSFVLARCRVDLYPLYLASLAAATADTWATEIGSAVGGPTFSLRDLRRVTPGTSGGVSVAGSVAAAAGALTIALFGLLFSSPAGLIPASFRASLCPFVAGMLGALADSLLGATLQAQWRDPRDPQRIVEAPVAGERPVRGLAIVDNDWVNLACTASAAIIAWFLR